MGCTYSGYQTFRDTTDAKGKFIFELEKEDNAQYDLVVNPVNNTPVYVYNTKPFTKDLKVVLPKGGTVFGTLYRMVNGRKQPVANGQVKLENPDTSAHTHLGFHYNKTIRTDKDGKYSFKHIRTKQLSDNRKGNDFVPRQWTVSHMDTKEFFSFEGDTYELEIDLIIPDSN